MKRLVAGAFLIPGVVAAVGVLVLVLWVRGAALVSSDVSLRTAEGPGGATISAVDGVAAGGHLIPGPGKPPIDREHPRPTDAAWSARGPASAARIATTSSPPVRRVPAANWRGPGPPLAPRPCGRSLWARGMPVPPSRTAGSICWITTPKPPADSLRCLSLETGEEIWRYTYPVRVKWNHGMSRTSPP